MTSRKRVHDYTDEPALEPAPAFVQKSIIEIMHIVETSLTEHGMVDLIIKLIDKTGVDLRRCVTCTELVATHVTNRDGDVYSCRQCAKNCEWCGEVYPVNCEADHEMCQDEREEEEEEERLEKEAEEREKKKEEKRIAKELAAYVEERFGDMKNAAKTS